MKIHSKLNDDIDTCGVFHKHFTSSFCANILLTKNYKSLTVIKEKLRKTFIQKTQLK